MRIAAKRYINPTYTKTRTGSDIDDAMRDGLHTSIDGAAPENMSGCLYPKGKRLTNGGTKARLHSPHDESAAIICWDSNYHSGCFRGTTCTNAHARFKPGPLSLAPTSQTYQARWAPKEWESNPITRNK